MQPNNTRLSPKTTETAKDWKTEYDMTDWNPIPSNCIVYCEIDWNDKNPKSRPGRCRHTAVTQHTKTATKLRTVGVCVLLDRDRVNKTVGPTAELTNRPSRVNSISPRVIPALPRIIAFHFRVCSIINHSIINHSISELLIDFSNLQISIALASSAHLSCLQAAMLHLLLKKRLLLLKALHITFASAAKCLIQHCREGLVERQTIVTCFRTDG